MSPRHSTELKLEHVLLALLDQKPMHGYELYQELSTMSGISKIWNIKQSLLYADLDKLETKGYLSSRLVQGESYPPRKYFEITNVGKETLHRWIKTPVRRPRDVRQEFLAKLIVARRYGKSAMLELIQVQIQACQAWLDELHTSPTTFQPGTQVEDWLVYSFRYYREDGIMHWLKQCEAEILKMEDTEHIS
jgi:DNA-binding PadR family transcriptional regulator